MVSCITIHVGKAMAATQSLRVFKVGDKVRVRSGVVDPDYDDLTIGNS